jgi:hypothetical protein
MLLFCICNAFGHVVMMVSFLHCIVFGHTQCDSVLGGYHLL